MRSPDGRRQRGAAERFRLWTTSVVVDVHAPRTLGRAEPRQNRKRGDDLAAVEYVQMEDPEIQKRRVKAAIDEALNKS
jgi:hypothetical protein